MLDVTRPTPTSSVSLELLEDYWLVPSQMSFENVGVTRSVNPQLRYLLCSECDKGPVGINFLAEPNKFYVAHARCKHIKPNK